MPGFPCFCCGPCAAQRAGVFEPGWDVCPGLLQHHHSALPFLAEKPWAADEAPGDDPGWVCSSLQPTDAYSCVSLWVQNWTAWADGGWGVCSRQGCQHDWKGLGADVSPLQRVTLAGLGDWAPDAARTADQKLAGPVSDAVGDHLM